MRRNFELFGDFIGMDMMKRGINTLLWPYFLVTMYNEMSKICIACEGILCGEREDMYQFACDFLGAASPKRPLSEVKVVAGDGFLIKSLPGGLASVMHVMLQINGICLILAWKIFLGGPVMNCFVDIWSIL